MVRLEGSDPTSIDPIDLQLLRAAAVGSGNPQTSTTSDTFDRHESLLQVTSYHRDKACFLSWKLFFLIAVRAIGKPFHEGFKKIEDKMSKDFWKSRLSNEELEFADHTYILLALFAEMKRVLMWDPRRTEAATKRGKYYCEHERFGMRHTSSISYWTQLSRHQTRASIFDSGTQLLRSVQQELVSAWVKEFERQSTWTKSHHVTCDSKRRRIKPVWTRQRMSPREKKNIIGFSWGIFTWWERSSWIRSSSWKRPWETREARKTWWKKQGEG